MSLQDLYYLASIIAMSFLSILFIALIVLVLYLYSKIRDMANYVSHPGKIVASVGEAVIHTAVEQVGKLFSEPKKRRRKIK